MKPKKSKLLECVKKMPPLFHTIPGEQFDIKKSRVIWWLVKQPDLLAWLWDHVRQSGYVEHDPATGKWQGIEFEVNADED